MNKVSEQGEDEFCQEIELLARLHHRHFVALRGSEACGWPVSAESTCNSR